MLYTLYRITANVHLHLSKTWNKWNQNKARGVVHNRLQSRVILYIIHGLIGYNSYLFYHIHMKNKDVTALKIKDSVYGFIHMHTYLLYACALTFSHDSPRFAMWIRKSPQLGLVGLCFVYSTLYISILINKYAKHSMHNEV